MNGWKKINNDRLRRSAAVVAGVSFLSLAGAALFRPLPTEGLTQAAAGYRAALRWVGRRRETEEIDPRCATQLMTHGRQAERVALLFHGYTSCPGQFSELGRLLYERGYNVLIPRMPRHGLADRMTTAHADLTAEELTAYAVESLEVARTLGEQVTVVGLSTGGLLTGWVAQQYEGIERAVLIAPVFGFGPVPAPLTRPLGNLLLTLPNIFRWYDPRLKARLPGPDYMYPRYASRTLAQLLRLAEALRADMRRRPPRAGIIHVVINHNDDLIHNGLIEAAVADWQRLAPQQVRAYHFAADLKLGHDIVDPCQPGQRVDIVHPVLLKLITGS